MLILLIPCELHPLQYGLGQFCWHTVWLTFPHFSQWLVWSTSVTLSLNLSLICILFFVLITWQNKQLCIFWLFVFSKNGFDGRSARWLLNSTVVFLRDSTVSVLSPASPEHYVVFSCISTSLFVNEQISFTRLSHSVYSLSQWALSWH